MVAKKGSDYVGHNALASGARNDVLDFELKPFSKLPAQRNTAIRVEGHVSKSLLRVFDCARR